MTYNKGVGGKTVGPNGNTIGRPLVKKTSKVVSFNISVKQNKKLAAYALEHRDSKSGLIQKFIDSL